MNNLSYYNLTKAELESKITQLGFIQVTVPGTSELVYSKVIQFEGAPTVIRLYTAIDATTGQSRPAGSDAIRVTLGRPGTDGQVRIFKSLEKVKRTPRWFHSLMDRMDEIMHLDKLTHAQTAPATLSEADLLAGRTTPVARTLKKREDLKCPSCGGHMVGPKPSRKGQFYGCARFPMCRGSVDAFE